MASVLFVNTTVFSRTVKRTLLPWTIQEVPEPNYTFADFFTSVLRPKLPSSSHVSPTDDTVKLELSLVGPHKETLDPVDPNLPVIPVISSFGRFLRYEVTTTSDTQCTVEGVPQNAFDVLTESARQMYLQQNETGNLQVVTERNRQHKLYNDIIKQLTSQGLSFKADEVDTSGTKLVRLLCDILWHIDGHHHVFRLRSVAIPTEFEEFSFTIRDFFTTAPFTTTYSIRGWSLSFLR